MTVIRKKAYAIASVDRTFIIIIIVYYAEAARHTDNRYYDITQRKHKSCSILRLLICFP